MCRRGVVPLHYPSPGTPGEGWGEGLRLITCPVVLASSSLNPHPASPGFAGEVEDEDATFPALLTQA